MASGVLGLWLAAASAFGTLGTHGHTAHALPSEGIAIAFDVADQYRQRYGSVTEHHGPHDPTATVDLYGVNSGFAKARLGVNGERRSITVGPLPDELDTPEWYAVLDRAMDEWNTAAGWWLFQPDFSGAPTDVTFGVDDARLLTFGAWVEWEQFPTGWYRGCRILTHSWGPPLESTIAHELGHCLGFVDMPSCATAYVGVMSYCRPADLFPNNDQDVASLVAAGYREE